MKTIKIATDFAEAPGPRYKKQGDKSGELFRELILEPAYLEAKRNNDAVEIDFDGVYGYFDSFLEEAFGGLARKYKDDNIRVWFRFKSNEDPSVISRVEKYIYQAK